MPLSLSLSLSLSLCLSFSLSRQKWDEADAIERDQSMINTFKDAIFAATAHAPRFKILPGEALLIDNYTALHVREGYADMGRRGWRVWMWAKGALVQRDSQPPVLS